MQSSFGFRSWLTLVAGLCTSAALAFSCGGTDVATGGDPCEGELADLCGGPCNATSDCAAGLYCNAFGKCDADCTPDGGQCDGECSADGQCGGGGSSSGNGGTGAITLPAGGAGGSGGDDVCGAIEISFEPVIPNVVLLIDQSGSMNDPFDGQQRWEVVYDALMNPTDGVVKTLEGQVRFGLSLYTYPSGGPVCPVLVNVLPPQLNGHAAIDDVYEDEGPDSNTPTGDALVEVAGILGDLDETGPKIIILATDGDPDRCEDPDGHDAVSKLEVTDAAQAAYLDDIQTFIIAVGNEVSDQHQQDVANAGQGLPVPADWPCNDPMVCAPTYEPTTKQALVDDFISIINGQRECVFQLDGEVLAGKECQGTVLVNGQEIPCNDPDGWQLNDPGEIEFVGATCDEILNDPDVSIEASFPCDSIATAPPQ